MSLLNLNDKKYQPFIKVVAALAVILGIVDIAGWVFNIQTITRPNGQHTCMVFNTALAFILLGTALYLRLKEGKARINLSKLLAVAVLIIGLLSFSQNLSGYDFSIDQLLFSYLGDNAGTNPFPGRMASITAFCFIFMAMFIFGSHSNRKGIRTLLQVLLHTVTLLSFLVIIGYMFNVRQFHQLSSSISMALETAIAFFLLSIASSLINPSIGITGLFTGNQIGNVMIRKTFLQLIALVLILTYMRILSYRLGVIDVEIGIILFSLSFIIASLVLIGGVSRELNTINYKKSEAETNLFRINAFLDSTPDPIFVIDLKGIILLANKQAVNIFGFNKNELIGKNIDLLIPLRFRNKRGSLMYGFYSSPAIRVVGEDQELFALKKDQTELPVEITTSPIPSSDGTIENVSVAIRDISWRKQVETQLKESNERNKIFIQELEAISNSGYVSMIGTDTEGVITYFNKGAEQMLQYTASEMVGIHSPVLIHLEEEIVKRGNELSDLFRRTISGFDVFVELVRQGKYESREWTFVRKDSSNFPVQLIVTAIRNNKEEITGFLGVATDISVIKNAQQELKSLLKITTEQNSRLKNFAHIVSHNLSAHSGNLGMLLDIHISDYPEMENDEMITHLKTSSDKLIETIAHLNEIVLINTTVEEQLDPVNLHAAIESASHNVSFIAKSAVVQIINEVDSKIYVLGLAAYMDSVLLNFITNGIKYRSPDRLATITFSALIENQFVILQIEDNGIGIDLEKNESKLFGMYKTFHNNQDARGIGLFITKNQVEAMGGRIEVKSELNKGTIFKIYLKNV